MSNMDPKVKALARAWFRRLSGTETIEAET